MLQLKTRLPTVPSALIRAAMADLEEVEKMSSFKIFMGVWFEPDWNRDGRCAVCLAGSVIANRVPINVTKEHGSIIPTDFDEETRHLLMALDHFRQGAWLPGAKRMIEAGVRFVDLSVFDFYELQPVKYADDPDAFKEDMETAAMHFESKGL